MKFLRGKKDNYFKMKPARFEMLNEDSNSKEDFENEFSLVTSVDFESGDDSDCSCGESQLQIETTGNIASFHMLSKSSLDESNDAEWEVECTPRVLKKLDYRNFKMPYDLRKAICATIFDLAKGRYWHRVKTHNEKHQLFKKRVPGWKTVSILWERVMQFSPQLTHINTRRPVYTDVIRLWDIVMNEESYKQVMNAIENHWGRERTIKRFLLSEEHELKPSDVGKSQNQIPSHAYLFSDDDIDIRAFISTDPDPAQYKSLIVHAIPHNIYDILSFSSYKFDLPIKLSPEEYEIINMKSDNPIVVLGRSGTGKTTCCLYRMVQDFQHHELPQSDSELHSYLHPFRQVFITKSKFLCKKVEEQFLSLTKRFHTWQKIRHRHRMDVCNPVFMTNDEFLYWLDHSINGNKVIHTCDPHVGCGTFGSWNTATKLNASYFVNNIWKIIRKRNPQFNPQLVWKDITNFFEDNRALRHSEEEHYHLSPRVALNFANIRRKLDQIFQSYEHDLLSISERPHDKCDLILSLNIGLVILKDASQNDLPWLFDSLYIDEIQDFTQSEILLFLQCCKNPKENVFLTGDTTQSIVGDVSFRFKDLRALLQKANFLPKEAPEIKTLQINYESHTGIHNLTRFVLDLVQTYYPDSRDIPPNDNALFVGPKPKFIKPCDKDTLMHLLASNVHNSSDIHFGHHQAIIVRNGEREREMPIKNSLLFSVYECEGLEFDDVLLYNFFSDIEVSASYTDNIAPDSPIV